MENSIVGVAGPAARVLAAALVAASIGAGAAYAQGVGNPDGFAHANMLNGQVAAQNNAVTAQNQANQANYDAQVAAVAAQTQAQQQAYDAQLAAANAAQAQYQANVAAWQAAVAACKAGDRSQCAK